MRGCRWQDKSFTVPVKETAPLGYCDACGNGLEGIKYLYNGKQLCSVCFSAQPSVGLKRGLGFNTNRDKLWEFVDNKTFRKPVFIHSKRQWQRLLKQHGLTDDFNQSYKSMIREMKPKKYEPVKREFIAKQISEELYSKGLYDKLIKRRR